MFLKGLICVLLLTAIAAKHYSIDKDLNVEEISQEASEFLKSAPHVMATTEFVDNLNSTGWTYFTTHTNGLFPDSLQTYSAGFLEGYLAYNYVWAAWKNNEVDFEQSGFTSMPANVSDWIHNQTNWAHQMVRENPNDAYWNLVNATFAQLKGTYDGFIAATIKNKRPDMTITFINSTWSPTTSILLTLLASLFPLRLLIFIGQDAASFSRSLKMICLSVMSLGVVTLIW